MGQVRSVTRPRRLRTWLAVLALVPALVFGVSRLQRRSRAPRSRKVIADKGTPLRRPAGTQAHRVGHRRRRRRHRRQAGDRQPPRRRARAGHDGQRGRRSRSPAQLSPDGLTWSTTEPLGYNKQLHAQRAVARASAASTSRADDLRDALAGEPDDALRAAQRRRGRRRRSADRGPLRREHPEPGRRRAGHQGHHQPAGRGRVLLAQQSRGALAPSRTTGSPAPRSTSRSTPTVSISATACSARRTSPPTSPSATR